MDIKDVRGQLFDTIRESFKTSMDTMSLVQAQTEKMFKLIISQMSSASDEANKIVEEWIDTGKEMRDKYRDNFETSLKKLESYLSSMDR